MKKAFAMLTAMMMTAAIAVPMTAFAETAPVDKTNTNYYYAGNQTTGDYFKLDHGADTPKACKTEVSYDVPGIYFVTIPASVKLGANEVEGTFKVTGETDDKAPLLEEGQTVNVKLTGSTNYNATNSKFYVKAGTSDNAKLEYTVKTAGGQAVALGGTVAAFPYQPNFTVANDYTKKAKFAIGTGTPQYAGTYTDTLTFTVSVDNAAAGGAPESQVDPPAPQTMTITGGDEEWNASVTVTFTPGQKWSQATFSVLTEVDMEETSTYSFGWIQDDEDDGYFRDSEWNWYLANGNEDPVGKDDLIDVNGNYHLGGFY